MNVAMKFGGTSVADPDAIGRLMGIVDGARAAGGPPVVIVSALGGVTDRLLEAASLAEGGDAEAASAAIGRIVARHEQVATALTSGSRRDSLIADLHRDFGALTGLVKALAVLREVSPRSLDAVAATGELASSRIVADALAERGVPAMWVDARQLMVTDAEHTGAAPDMDATRARTREVVGPMLAQGQVPVLGGFIGATPDGITTTLGRGGSDYSAAIFGASLDVDEIQIWTDVDGMLTADPRVVTAPQLVRQLTFAEASELAYFGAKVLHPSTILPAVDRNIPVRILNSRRPEVIGTRITADSAPDGATITAIACKRDVTVVDITSTRMLMAHGFLRRLFEVFERFRTAVDVVTTSEVSVSVTVDDKRRLEAIVENLRTFADVSCEPSMAIVCVVGEHLQRDPKVFARAVTAIDSIPLRLVSQASARRNITFVMRDADVPKAMNDLHEAFFGAAAGKGA